MKKLWLLTSILIGCFLFYPKDTLAFSSSNYQYKSLCGNYEVAGMHSDGVIDPVACLNTFEEAQAWMKNNGADDLVVFGKVSGKTKILDANVALVDLSVNPETLTYFYTDKEKTSSYTYMDTGSLYGGVDGALIDASYSNAHGRFMIKVKIGNFTGWILDSTYEIVPITWVKSSSSYTVTNEDIKHNYVNKIQETYNGSRGSVIGPKPDMLSPGTYYSYDGKYFYKDRKTMIKDYKNGNYNNAVNKNNEYYNYYMYLSNHTRTSYSSQNIDEYIRNNMGISMDAYGNKAESGASRLYGKGIFYYYAQEKYGVNALLSLSLSRNESGNGTSNLAVNKNNGFGLNAVDSNPYGSASQYVTYAHSILGYASDWITYGYAHPRDWRYFGPQFGDKWIGMNVKYASDTYWSEKMASHYYAFDKAKGLQDYNYYQLGVMTKGAVWARSDAKNSAKGVYQYPEAEDGVVIVGEKQGDSVEGNTTWYEVVGDLNIDNNYNEITSGDYNWNKTVYVPAAYVKKINKGKNGYISPNNVTQYQDRDYEYDLYAEGTSYKPRVGKSTKDTDFYYDSSLTAKKNQKLVNNRYVMVYAAAKNKDGVVTSYLVTSDYKYDQKHWVSADSINLVTSDYGKFSVTASGNQYTWVNSVPEDTKATLISGHYTNSYAPILEEKTVNGQKWYKVPVDISGNTNEFGWTLASAPNVYVEKMNIKADNTAPVIIASDKQIVQGTKFDYKKDVTATDTEDGNLTNKIVVEKETVDIDKVGEYQVTYKVTDNNNVTTTKTITVTVTENKKPVINAEDKEVIQYRELDELKDVTATDEEDGEIKVKVKESTVKLEEPGIYEITYEATDTYNQTTTETIKVTVIKDEAPVIDAEDKTITQGTKFDPLEDVTATDKEEGEVKKIEVVKNEVKENKTGKYEVTYKVVDSYKNETTKTITVTVVENQKPVINVEDKTIYLNEKFDPLEGVTAEDPEDGKIKDIEVTTNEVNTEEVGTYKVVYKVEDSYGNVVEKEITVTVKEKKLEEKDGTFYFHYLKESNNKLLMQGYQTITGIDNNLDTEINYKVILENIDTGETTEVSATRIIKKEDIPKAVYSPDGKDYTYSWFNAEININNIENGNYKMYMEASTNEYYSKSIINNKTYNEQATKVEGNKHSAIISNNFSSQTSFVELKVRDELLANKTSSYIYNQYDKYTEFSFTEDNKLHLRGNSYSYGADLSKNQKVTRKILFENVDNYKLYTKNLGTITDGNYTVVLPVNDNLDKSQAWYNNDIDISDIEKGRYVIYITTTSNITDIAEMTEKLGRSLENVKATINGKNYHFTINKDRGNRIEMIVE